MTRTRRSKAPFLPSGFLLSGVLFLISGFWFLLSAAAAPPVPLGLEKYTFPQYWESPNETQLKFLLKGARADPLDPQSNRTRVTKARLETYRTNGAPEMIVEADQCVSDKNEQLVNSADALRAWTADGKFLIEGVGFVFRQTNKDLVISNRVHTIILTELLDTTTPTTKSNASASDLREIEIFSDRFHGSPAEGAGVYTSHLRVTGTNLNVTGGILTVRFPPDGSLRPSGIDSLIIQTNVVMDYVHEPGAHKQVFHVTGATARYVASNGLFYVRGNPTWAVDLQQGRGDELIIDRTNKIFTANGHGYLIMPGQSGGQSSFLSRPGTASPTRKTENEFIEVRSDHYQFRTNVAVFRGGVEVRDLVEQQTQGTMSCGRMTITFSGTNELQRMVAEDGVVIQQETNRLTGGHAVYTATNGVLELTETPAWEAGTRQGNGDLVQLLMRLNEMSVSGHASLRLPAESFGSGSLAPAKPGAGGASASSPPKPKPSGGRFAQILCDSYTIGQTNGHFVGGVSITHPEINWQCGDLQVYWPRDGGHVEKMVAERAVRFNAITPKGEKTSGSGDEAVYTYSVTDGVTNEILHLTGNPATLVGTNNMNFHNSVITYDLGRQQIIATGSYRASSGATNKPSSSPSLLPNIAPPRK